MAFLHGAEVLEIATGPRPIQTVRSGVIGIVGTAPNAEGATAATLTLGNAPSGTGITFTAPKPVLLVALVPYGPYRPLGVKPTSYTLPR